MMSWLDWIIVCVPLAIVLVVGLRSQKYVRGVAGFLAADRVAGRYVVAVAGGEAAMGLISIVAMIERDYSSGFGFSFWNRLGTPLGLLFALTGYCTYRFRETKAMTMGQFFELRYSRAFRIFAAFLQAFSGILNYAIFPAVGARFLIYFMDLPAALSFGGATIPTTALVMAVFLGVALFVALLGGQVTIMVTDCVQGLLSYPMCFILIAYILYRFDWWREMAPALGNRVPGESFLNPYDIKNLRNFNLFYVVVGLFSSVFNRMAWSGAQGYAAAAKTAHEQKMSGLLGTWRGSFMVMMYTLLAVSAFTYLNHPDFAREARGIRLKLAEKTIDDIAPGARFSGVRSDLKAAFRAIPEQRRPVDGKHPISQQDNLDTPYQKAARERLKTVEGGAGVGQTFRTIYGQMLVPVAIREMLPMGLTGIFCAVMILLMISTDTTYMHSWGGVIAQDIVLPLRGKPFTPKQHMLLLRCCLVLVCLTAYFFSLFFSQMDYILMFFQITGAIWMGGAGSCIVFGLYSRRGTTAGAFSALISGGVIAVGGFVMQSLWADRIYPLLVRQALAEQLDALLRAITAPLSPYVVWRVAPDRFPINSQEILFISMLSSIVIYIVVSALTCRKPFNLERMLHRGIYSPAGSAAPTRPRFTFRGVMSTLLGITGEYSRSDKFIAWAVFIYSFVYGFLANFIVVVVWNAVSPWPAHWWKWYFFVTSIVVTGIVAVTTWIWFTAGGVRDLIRLFAELRNKSDNALDDGSVSGHVSAADAAAMEKIEKNAAVDK